MTQNRIYYYLKSGLYFFARYILNKKYLIGCSDKYDLKFRFRTPDSVGRLIFKKGVYEEELSDYLISNLDLESGDIVFDVGANIGWYSIILSKYFSGVQVHSFEPDPENFKILKFNVALNNFENVISNNIGLGKQTDIVEDVLAEISKMEGKEFEEFDFSSYNSYFYWFLLIKNNPSRTFICAHFSAYFYLIIYASCFS
jgi:hypothetical protein